MSRINRLESSMHKKPVIVLDAMNNNNKALDNKYQNGFREAINKLPKGEFLPAGWCPPCPACNGKMVPWDAWLVTGATCEKCGWNYSEGSGCLV